MESTTAILLRKTRFGDTSLIVTWLTLGHGKLKTAARGALRAKSRFTLDLFFTCDISFARSAKSEVHALRESVLREPHDAIRRDYPRVALAAYFAELLELATEPEHDAPELFDLLTRALAHLAAQPATRRALLHFEKELVRHLGIANPGLTAIIAFGRAYHRIPAGRPALLRLLPEKVETSP